MPADLVLNLMAVCMTVVAILGMSWIYYDIKLGVPTYPTSPAVRRAIIALLQADAAARPDARPYTVTDLGSGSGQLVWHIARAMPEARVIGVEYSFFPWLRSFLRQRLFGPKNLTCLRRDFWSHDTAPNHAVITYLLGAVMQRMSGKLQTELTPGTLIISNRFPLRAPWQPYDQQTVIFKPFKTNLFLYRKEGRGGA